MASEAAMASEAERVRAAVGRAIEHVVLVLVMVSRRGDAGEAVDWEPRGAHPPHGPGGCWRAQLDYARRFQCEAERQADAAVEWAGRSIAG